MLKDASWKCPNRCISKMVALLTNIFIYIIGKEGKEMMAMLWAQQIILGKKPVMDRSHGS